VKLSTGPSYAQALLTELHITGVPDVRAVASQLNLELNEVDVDGFDGVLIRAEGVPFGAIAVRSAMREEGRKNFTIAHEIGHFVLPGHENCGGVCLSSDIANWSDAAREKEREADEFAAELIVPTSYAQPRFMSARPSLQLISEIARDCRVSLSATAWRYCDLVTYACAIVWSADGKIVWSKASTEFGFYIRRGKILEKGTLAYAAFDAAETTIDTAQSVGADLWLENDYLDDSAEIWEQSFFLRNYNSVLSLLWIERPVITKDETQDLLPELDPFRLDSYRRRR
jgi:hypothetical protein